MKTKEEISQLLATKFQRESARLKSWGTKTDEKASMSFAMAVSEFVRAMMADSRNSELRRIVKFISKNGIEAGDKDLTNYIQERLTATKAMAKAIEHVAVAAEGKRPWKPKVHKHRSKHEHKHRHK